MRDYSEQELVMFFNKINSKIPRVLRPVVKIIITIAVVMFFTVDWPSLILG